jgi:hypothetical protein
MTSNSIIAVITDYMQVMFSLHSILKIHHVGCNSFDYFFVYLDFALDFAFRLNESHLFVLSRKKKRPISPTQATKFFVC